MSSFSAQTYLQKLQKMEKSPRDMLARDKALTTSFQVNSFIWGWLCSLVRKKLISSQPHGSELKTLMWFCTNTVGSYVCTCPHGYASSLDGTRCLGEPGLGVK